MSWLVWTAGLWLLASPGVLVAKLLRLRSVDPLVRAALIVAAGMSAWPLLLLWTSVAGLRWSAGGARAFALVTMIGAAMALATDRRLWVRLRRWRHAPFLPWLGAFLLLAAATVWTRWMHARELAFPPWVDAVHHTMIVRLILDHGSVPQTLSPIIEGGDFYYHWGFHAMAAWTAWLLGIHTPTDLPRFLLDFGQMLNALTLLMVYAAGRVLLRSRWSATIAAGCAMLVSYFPAYYLSWGRYTHLAGILVAPALLIALWRLARAPGWRGAAFATLLTCGLVLIHVRIAFFAAIFAAELAVLLLWRRRWTAVTTWVAVAVFSAAIVSPWLIRVTGDRYARMFIAPSGDTAGDVHQVVPLDVLWAPHNRELLAIATCGISGMAGWLGMPLWGRIASALWWLLCIWLTRIRSQRDPRNIDPWRPLALLLLFSGVVALLLGTRSVGIDFTRFASVSSAVMSIFFPISLGAAAIICWAAQRLFGAQRTVLISMVIVIVTVVSGVLFLRDVVNPATVFADEADHRALVWIERHTPANARFMVNARPWMGPAWVGTDGGYWISVATNRRSTLPPLLYAWALPIERVAAIDRLLEDSNRPDALADPNILRELRAAGVGYAYFGSHADASRVPQLLASGRAQVIYRDGAVIILQLRL